MWLSDVGLGAKPRKKENQVMRYAVEVFKGQGIGWKTLATFNDYDSAFKFWRARDRKAQRVRIVTCD